MQDQAEIPESKLCTKRNQDYGLVTLIRQPARGSAETPPRLLLVAVYDGHGPQGEDASRFSALSIARSVSDAGAQGLATASSKLLHDAVLHADLDLSDFMETYDDAGTTATIALIDLDSRKLAAAWVGDSGMILASQGSAAAGSDTCQFWRVVAESTLHKPTDPDEAKRVAESGGSVRTYTRDDLTLHRICRPTGRAGSDTFVGLSMSRSIGDGDLKGIGIISTPETLEQTLEEEHACMILATDGVWDFLTHAEALEIAQRHHGDAAAAADEIVEEASRRYLADVGVYRDDATAAVLYLPLPDEGLSPTKGGGGNTESRQQV